MNKKIHSHRWVESVNEQCPWCGADMKLCESPKCRLYMCKNKYCRQVIQIKRRR